MKKKLLVLSLALVILLTCVLACAFAFTGCSSKYTRGLIFSNYDKYYQVVDMKMGDVTDIVIPYKFRSRLVVSIGDSAFTDCPTITSVSIPNSITRISDDAFEGCIALKNITLPDSVKTVGEEAFEGCTALTEITIPNSVTELGEGLINDCSSLVKITYKGTMEQWNSLSKDIPLGNENTGAYTVYCTDGNITK